MGTGDCRFFFCVFEILYIFLQLYMHVHASVTAGTVCPAAIYAVQTIYIPTNNADYIKYRTQKPHPISKIHPHRYLRGIFDEKYLDEIF